MFIVIKLFFKDLRTLFYTSRAFDKLLWISIREAEIFLLTLFLSTKILYCLSMTSMLLCQQTQLLTLQSIAMPINEQSECQMNQNWTSEWIKFVRLGTQKPIQISKANHYTKPDVDDFFSVRQKWCCVSR